MTKTVFLTKRFSAIFQIEIKQKDGVCPAPSEMAVQVVSYLDQKGFLQA